MTFKKGDMIKGIRGDITFEKDIGVVIDVSDTHPNECYVFWIRYDMMGDGITVRNLFKRMRHGPTHLVYEAIA